MFIIQRNAVIGENQKATLPPAAVLNETEHSGSLECTQGRLLESLEHQLKLVFCLRPAGRVCVNAPLANEVKRPTRL